MNNEKIEDILKDMGSEKVPGDIQQIAKETSDNFMKELTKSKNSKTHLLLEYIMNSKLTKLAAAAVIIIAVFTISSMFSSSNVLWAEVVEQINNHTRYKCRQRVVREQGPQIPVMQVYHLNLQQRRQELEDGTIHIIDMRENDPVTVELYPKEKRAVITKLTDFGSRSDPDVIEMVKRFDEKSTERLGTKKQDGKTLYGFRYKPNEYNDYTVWVDSDTKLPVEIELKHPTAGQTIFLDEFEFDFKLDTSAFSTEVPDGYKVETLALNYGTTTYEKVTNDEIRKDLNKAVYTIERLPWIVNMHTIKTSDPLGTGAAVYMTGIKANDGNTLIITQGDLYDMKRMVWIPNQQLVLETPRKAKLYTHPNGSIYAQYHQDLPV
jgi:hypothetical protein